MVDRAISQLHDTSSTPCCGNPLFHHGHLTLFWKQLAFFNYNLTPVEQYQLNPVPHSHKHTSFKYLRQKCKMHHRNLLLSNCKVEKEYNFWHRHLWCDPLCILYLGTLDTLLFLLISICNIIKPAVHYCSYTENWKSLNDIHSLTDSDCLGKIILAIYLIIFS